MEDTFIEPGILENLGGRTLFYPAAGCDWSEFLENFEDHIDEFRFSDIKYNFKPNMPSPFTKPNNYRSVSSTIHGEQRASMERRRPEIGRAYNFLEPGQLTEVFDRASDGRRIAVVRRRGFGQYALSEIEDRSLGIFVHRGDSPGECGSNIWFLSDWRCCFPPCGSLFATVSRKLADRALIISDGSNTRFKFLRKRHRTVAESSDVFEEKRKISRNFRGFEWTCVGHLSRRYGPTLVWSVVRNGSPEPQ